VSQSAFDRNPVGSQLSWGESIELLRESRGTEGETNELSRRPIDLERLDKPDICLLDAHSAGTVYAEGLWFTEELERYGVG
jgi:hypothetical protein